jgi:hypothetical protein
MVLGYAVKTLESKETKASKKITVTHNSVFAAHRLQCRMTTRKNRHPAFLLFHPSAQRRNCASFSQDNGIFASYAYFRLG